MTVLFSILIFINTWNLIPRSWQTLEAFDRNATHSKLPNVTVVEIKKMDTCQVVVNIFVMILIMSGSLSGEIEYQVLSKQKLT